MKNIFKFAALCGAMLISAPLVAQTSSDIPVIRMAALTSPAVDLNVSASVDTAPDLATFTTGVETLAPKARDAIRQNAIKMTAVITQLKAQGIADADIQTSSQTLSREVEYLPTGKTRFKGYRVGNRITVKLRDFAKLPDMLDLIAASGATEFDGPIFSLDDDSAAMSIARDKAWDTAYKQARYHAQKAGYSGVKVMRVAETISRRGRQPEYDVAKMAVAMDAAAQATSTPVEPGEITSTVSLSISFEMVK
jgi:uncharacterized protein